MNNDQTQIKQDELVWEAPSFIHYPKNFFWYLAFGITSALLLLFSWYSGGVITISLFALLLTLVLFFSFKKPEIIKTRLTINGIQKGDMFYPYRAIKKFWILYYPPEVKVLHIETGASINQNIKIELGGQNPIEVRNYLKKYLQEDMEQEESLVDVITRKLRF